MKRSARHFTPSRQRRKRSPWALMVGTVLAASSATPAFAAPAPDGAPRQSSGTGANDTRVLQFQIPAGPLDGALAEFRRVTGLNVELSNPRIGSVQSPGVTGSLTPPRALEALLKGTNVRSTYSASGVRLELPEVRATVDVEETVRMRSPKYTEPVRDTPQTIAVIPKQLFLEQNATSLREVLRNTPGITMSIGEGTSGIVANGDQVLIRGFNARNDIFVDGLRDPGEFSRDTFNLESVEVAKGPTGVTSGRGATGGSINMNTKSAGLQDFSEFRVVAGSADYARATYDGNYAISKTVAVRFNTMWQDTGYPGRDIAKYEGWGIAPSLSLGLGTPTQVTMNYARQHQNNLPDMGLPALLPDVAVAQGVTINDLDWNNYYGIVSRDYEKTTSDVATLTVKHDFNQTMSVRNVTRYGNAYRDSVFTPPRPATTTAGQGPEDPGYDVTKAQMRRTDTKFQHRNDRMWANQSDFLFEARTGPIGHKADIGLEIIRDNQPTSAFAETFANGRPPVDDLYEPTPNVAYTAVFNRTGASTLGHVATVGVYVFDTVKFNKQWQADLGGRYDHVDADYANTATNGVVTNFGRIDKVLTGRAGLVYKPKEMASIYGAISNSFTPSYDATHGLTLSGAGATNQALAPERTWNLEFGTKWELPKNFIATAAAFQVEKVNAKTVDSSGATVLAGDQRVRGLEFGLAGNLTSRWSAYTGLALMNSKVVASGNPIEVDQQMAYVPHISFNSWTSYKFPFKLLVAGGANYTNGHFFNQTGGFLFVSNRFDTRYVKNAAAIQELTRYLVFNSMASYPLHRNIELQVNFTNIGGEEYADRAYDRHFLPGPGRQFLVTPVIKF